MCGIVGFRYTKEPAAPDAYIGLMHLQHRGKEAAQIVTYDGRQVHRAGGKGEAAQVFSPKGSLAKLAGSVAIGQTRYGTTGGTLNECNWQPIPGNFHGREFYVVHNGNLVNLNKDNTEANRSGVSDTYQFVQLLSQSRKTDFLEAVQDTVRALQGSFCFIIMFRDKLIAIRDRFGFHPLVMGKKNGGYGLASETCALDMAGAEFIRDIHPGEICMIDANGYNASRWTDEIDLKLDIFEFIYFLRPDSIIHGVKVDLARRIAGAILAREHPADADLVVPIPDSANDAGWGYWQAQKGHNPATRIETSAFFRPHIISRTFIEPIQADRQKAQKQKFNTDWTKFLDTQEGVVIVDDSLIRGTTIRARVRDLQQLHGKQYHGLNRMRDKLRIPGLHIRIASPPYRFPDYYGVDTYRAGEDLIINRFSNDTNALARYLGVRSLEYLSLEGVKASVLQAQQLLGLSNDLDWNSFYTGPFTGIYPDGTGYYANT